MEGGALSGVFERFIETSLSRGVIFKTLSKVADESRGTLSPTYEIEDGFVPGRAGKVAMPGILTKLI
jgi:hypothetical protein